MSLTARDEPLLKAPQSDTTDAELASCEVETMNDDRACAAADVVATLCRMSLLREEPLSVSGGYARSPPDTA